MVTFVLVTIRLLPTYWHVTVNLTRNAMWYQTLGLVDPGDAGCDDEHSIGVPDAYDADTPMGRGIDAWNRTRHQIGTPLVSNTAT